jgi:hypothetical protein
MESIDTLSNQEDMGVEEALTQCITMLLGVFYARMEDDREADLERDLGEIRIITDPSGAVGERISQAGSSDRYTTYFACTQTESDAYELEYQLAQWAVDPERIATIIRSIQPDYRRSEFIDEFNEVVEKVTDVFFKATVIPSGSPLSIMLHKKSGLALSM